MTSRERFEAWAGNPLMMGMRGGKYHNDHVQIRWEAWQAAERSAIERCVKICDLAARSIEAARAHADGSLGGANPQYFHPILKTISDITNKIRAEIDSQTQGAIEMNSETGGQAFPCLERGGNGLDLTDGGMTLRQYAVIKFIAAEISREGLEGGEIEKIVAMAHEYVTELLEWGE